MTFDNTPVITWDYQFIPNGQKARNLLYACGIPYQCCEQPLLRPRPAITDLGITYRRMPINSIGKDVYCDNRVFLDAVQLIFADRALPKSPADAAYESLGYRSFWISLPLFPPGSITPEIAKDREDLFAMVNHPNLASLRPNSLAEFRSLIDMFEKECLVPGPWVGGQTCSVADIHSIWVVKWALQTLGVGSEPGFSKADFPRVWKWIEALPEHNEQNHPEKLDVKSAHQKLLSSSYAATEIGIDQQDETGLKYGMTVVVSTTDDAKPGKNCQKGKLIGLGRREIVVELPNGIRVHFPRIGYSVYAAG